VKHRHHPDAQVELSGRGHAVDLCISDAGAGFDLECVKQKGGLGLVSMTERLRLIGGHFSVSSDPSQGTHIRVHVPLANGSVPGTFVRKHSKANA